MISCGLVETLSAEAIWSVSGGSFVVTSPDSLAAAASNLAGIASSLTAANGAAAAPTTGVLTAGADEVSSAIAALFGAHGQEYQAVSSNAASFHSQFVNALSSSAT